MRTAIYAILVGAILLGLVFSTMPFLTYQDTRIVSVSITNDASGPLSLIPNNDNLGYSSQENDPYIFYNHSGDLQIQLNSVQTNSKLTLSPAFFVDDNLNQTVKVTITVVGPLTTQGTRSPEPAVLLVNGSTTLTFTLSPSEGEVPVYLTLLTYGTTPGETVEFQLHFTEVYPAS
jgi:hypothetical protein